MSTTRIADRSPAHHRRRDAVRLLLAWGLILVVGLVVGLALTGPLEGSVGVGDTHVTRWLATHRSATLTDGAHALSLLGETWTILILGPILLLFTWLWRREIRPVVFLAVTSVGEIVAYLLTVNIVSRHRPPVVPLDQGLDPTHSYPSGHVAAAMATYGGMAVLIWALGNNRWRWLAVALVALPPLVAVARLYQGVHHPSDVVASLVFMSVWLTVTAAILLTGCPIHHSKRHG